MGNWLCKVQLVEKFKKKGSDIKEGGCDRCLYIDLHPCEPWVLFAATSQSLQVWNYKDGTPVASWTVPDGSNARSAKFIGNTAWVVVQNWSTYDVLDIQNPCMRLIKVIGAGGIASWRCFVVHPILSYLLTVTENTNVALWDYGQNWDEITTLRGHSNGIRALACHPSLSHLFATASGDDTIKVWDIVTRSVKNTIKDDDKGYIHAMNFCGKSQKPFLVTGDYYRRVRVWDYESGLCIANLVGHKHFVMQVFSHPDLPFIFSGSDDGEIRVWNESNYQLVLSYESGMRELCSMAPCRNSSSIVAGGQDEFVVLEKKKGNLWSRGIFGGQKSERDREIWEMKKKIEKFETEAVASGLEFKKQLEQQVSKVRLECKKELDEAREAHERTERIQTEKIRQLEGEVRDGTPERMAALERCEKSRLRVEELEFALRKETDLRHESDKSQAVQAKRIEQLERERAEFVKRLEESSLLIKDLKTKQEQGSIAQQDRKGSLTPSCDINEQNYSEFFREYSSKEVQNATDNFDDKWRCGDDNPYYGCLYVGKVFDQVLVKRVTIKKEDDRSKFKSRLVESLRSLRHPHLPTLLGACYEEPCLVYNMYMQNGSVKERISRGDFLPWYIRLRVMAQVARALCFLHSNQSVTDGGPIVHGAIKPANILLDDKFAAMITEVDNALIVREFGQEPQRMGGSMGMFAGSVSQYLAPEYMHFGILDEKTDIFALGVTILEMLTGKFFNACRMMNGVVEDREAFGKALDQNAGDWDVSLAQKVARLGLRCASLDSRHRPDMTGSDESILPVLEGVACHVELADSVKDV